MTQTFAATCRPSLLHEWQYEVIHIYAQHREESRFLYSIWYRHSQQYVVKVRQLRYSNSKLSKMVPELKQERTYVCCTELQRFAQVLHADMQPICEQFIWGHAQQSLRHRLEEFTGMSPNDVGGIILRYVFAPEQRLLQKQLIDKAMERLTCIRIWSC